MSKLEFGNVEQIKRVKEERRKAEQQDEWDRVVARSRQRVGAGVRKWRDVCSVDVSEEFDCAGCVRSECYWHADFVNKAPPGTEGTEPDLDIRIFGGDISVQCRDFVGE